MVIAWSPRRRRRDTSVSYLDDVEQLMTWLRSLGNAGAVTNAASLAERHRQDDFVVRSLTRRLQQAHGRTAASSAA
jgi:hypothetical protein